MSHAPSAALRRRHDAVRADCRRAGVDALIVTTRSNILYLTNFTGSAAIAIVTPDALHFITDFRYVTALETMQQSEHACPDLRLSVVQGSYLTSLGIARVAFEASHVTVSRYNWLIATLAHAQGAPTLVPLENVVERLRLRKDEYELSMLRESARLLSEVARGVFTEIRVGRTEREVAQAIDRRLLSAGFERPSFETIVASGPNRSEERRVGKEC